MYYATVLILLDTCQYIFTHLFGDSQKNVCVMNDYWIACETHYNIITRDIMTNVMPNNNSFILWWVGCVMFSGITCCWI